MSERMLWHLSLSLARSASNPDAVTVDPDGESLVVASDPDGVVKRDRFRDPAAQVRRSRWPIRQPRNSELISIIPNSRRQPAGRRRLVRLLRTVDFANYAPSGPFPVVLDDGVYKDEHPGQILAGALAINIAALLAGNYNHDDRVDVANYIVPRYVLFHHTARCRGSEDKTDDEVRLRKSGNNSG